VADVPVTAAQGFVVECPLDIALPFLPRILPSHQRAPCHAVSLKERHAWRVACCKKDAPNPGGPEGLSHGLPWKLLAATEAETKNSSEAASEKPSQRPVRSAASTAYAGCLSTSKPISISQLRGQRPTIHLRYYD